MMTNETLARLEKVATFGAANCRYITEDDVKAANKLGYTTTYDIARYAIGKDAKPLTQALGINVTSIAKNVEQRDYCAKLMAKEIVVVLSKEPTSKAAELWNIANPGVEVDVKPVAEPEPLKANEPVAEPQPDDMTMLVDSIVELTKHISELATKLASK